MEIEELRQSIKDELNPALVATELGFFVSDALKDRSITLYEALYLKDLEYSLLIDASEKTSWKYTVGISLLLSLELLYSLSLCFEENSLANAIKGKLSRAFVRLDEQRDHYAKEVASAILEGDSQSALKRLSASRCGAKPFKNGPYNNEVFPWDIISPEDEVLSRNFRSRGVISPAISELLSDILTCHG